MPPEAAAIAAGETSGPAKLPPWTTGLARIGIAWAALLLAFASDWSAMAGQWWNSSTYTHILIVPVILGWLVQQRWPELQRIEPVAWWPGFVLLTGAAFVWLLGTFAGLTLARQLGAVLIMAACVPALLGPRVTAALAFPLGYMLFLVPFGDELVPQLQMLTAEITIALVHASGIPASVDGVFIHTPAGLFKVAEACSGVKFLVAMVAFGALAAHVCFLSWRRRAAFLAACVVVPVLANGVRAWGTVYLAQIVGAERAAGFDHIVYGWIFFALVIAMVLGLGWRFFDRAADSPLVDVERLRTSASLARLDFGHARPGAALLALAAIILVARGWCVAADRLEAPLPARTVLPEAAGWMRTEHRPAAAWHPRAAGARLRLLGSYADSGGCVVDAFHALYAAQREGAEAGGFGEGAVPQGTAWAWHSPGPAIAGGKGDRLLADGSIGRVAVTWYRSGDLLTGSNTHLKFSAMADRLLLRERPTAMLILSAEERPGLPAERCIANFVRAVAPLNGWMDRIAAGS